MSKRHEKLGIDHRLGKGKCVRQRTDTRIYMYIYTYI